MAAERKMLPVRVDADLHRRLKVVLAREGKTFQEVFEDYLRRYLEMKESASESALAAPSQRP